MPVRCAAPEGGGRSTTTLRSTWDDYIGGLLAELPTLAMAVAMQAREGVHDALARAHGTRRQHLLALAHVLRAESSAFADALAAALQRKVQADVQPPADPGETLATAMSDRLPQNRQPLALSLVDDQQVERDIELARVIQLIESSAEWELRELQAFYATLRRARSIRAEHNPLRPEACAGALLSAWQDAGLDHEARLLAMQLSAKPIAAALRELYAQHSRLLRRCGVTAQSYRVRKVAPKPASTDRGDGTLSGLAERMAAREDRGYAAAPRSAAVESSRVPTARGDGVPTQLVAKLLEQIADQAEMNATLRSLLIRLRAPVLRATQAEAGALLSLEHPVWRLVDRIASLSSVHEGPDDGGLLVLAQLLEPIVARLEQAGQPGTAAFEEALNQVGDATLRLNSTRLTAAAEVDIDLTAAPNDTPTDEAPARDAPPHTLQLDDPQPAPAAHDVDATLRCRVADELRGSGAPPALRQFLLGPWVAVMARTIVRDGAQSSQALRWQNAVGDFIVQADAAARSRKPPSAAGALLELAAQGMESAAIPPHQRQSSLAELRRVLALAEAEAPPATHPRAGDSDQPTTVPMDMVATDADTPAKQDREAWLNGLLTGDVCRLFIQSRWMNAQLTWRSRNAQFYVYASRHGGRLHSLTRRQLARLRAEGLAATIERGQQVRDALDTLTMDLNDEQADRPSDKKAAGRD
ncbi:MAG TPA: DUF1631 family protein [Burkholderiaceae bacterium]|nr:DUF1631 family protein [Burkholderiaceae bacterium]